MSDPLSLVTGAKKQNELPDYDKNNMKTCVLHFNRLVLSNTPEKTKDSCIGYSLKGELDENYIRPTAWKIFLNTLPSSSDATLKTWIDTVKEQRKEFKKKVKEFTSLKKFKKDPLGGATQDKSWSTFFEDSEVKKLIDLDVKRTFQDKDLFCHEMIKDILKNILFLWAKENKDTNYKQGMNEILAILLYSLYPFYKKNPHAAEHEKNNDLLYSYLDDPLTHQNELYEFFHDEKELQTDLYYLFTSIMKQGVTKFYEDKKYKSTVKTKKKEDNEIEKTYINIKADEIIHIYLKKYDVRLYNHFVNIDLDCSIFLQRWLKCLFNREFHPKDVEIIWDVLLADEKKENKSGLGLVDYICVAMIVFIKEDLIIKDQNESFQRLFKYPPIESTYTIAELAINVRDTVVRRIEEEKEEAAKEPIKPVYTPISSHTGKGVLFRDKDNLQYNPPYEPTNNKSKSGKNINYSSLKNDPLSSNINPSSNNNMNISEGSPNFNPAKLKGLLGQMKEIFNKYRMQMELKDIGKMETLFEEMKNNL